MLDKLCETVSVAVDLSLEIAKKKNVRTMRTPFLVHRLARNTS